MYIWGFQDLTLSFGRGHTVSSAPRHLSTRPELVAGGYQNDRLTTAVHRRHLGDFALAREHVEPCMIVLGVKYIQHDTGARDGQIILSTTFPIF